MKLFSFYFTPRSASMKHFVCLVQDQERAGKEI